MKEYQTVEIELNVFGDTDIVRCSTVEDGDEGWTDPNLGTGAVNFG